jgi:predicted  nucleic acid-binding Zn-ribbon protein
MPDFSNNDLVLQCGDCGAHFQTTPSGSIDGAACSECGGKRFFFNQPNPVNSEGTLRDMVDSDSQKDQGGNPLGEGTIVGTDGEQNPGASTHGMDNFMHGSVHSHSFLEVDAALDKQSWGLPNPMNPINKAVDTGKNLINLLPVAEQTVQKAQEVVNDANTVLDSIKSIPGVGAVVNQFGSQPQPQEPQPDAQSRFSAVDPYQIAQMAHQRVQQPDGGITIGIDGQEHQGGGYGVALPSPNIPTHITQLTPQHFHQYINQNYDTLSQPGNYFGAWHDPKDGNVYPDISQIHPDFDTAMQAGKAANQEAIWDYQNQQSVPVPQESVPSDHLSHRMREYRPETLSMEPYPVLWSDEHVASLFGDIGQGAGVGAANAVPGVGAAVDAELASKAAPSLMKGVLGQQPQAQPQPNTGYATPVQQAPQPQAGSIYASIDIPSLLMLADFETADSVKSVDEQHDDPEKQDQKEFNDGDKSPSNLENPNNEDSGASGEDGLRNADPGYGFGPDSPGIQRLIPLLPLLLHYIQNDTPGQDDPLVQGLHEALEQENPGYMDKEHPEGPQSVQILLQQHDKPKTAGYRLSLNSPIPMPSSTIGPAALPDSDITPVQQLDNTCKRCGGVTNPNGLCPQCGNSALQPGGTDQPGIDTSGQGINTPQNRIMANHQGPVTDEQKEAIKQLIDVKPELFSEILDKIQNQPNTAPLVDPSQAPAPPQMPPSPQGAMPVPDMSQPGGGMSQPMQPMANARFADANANVPRCPTCGTATTSYMDGNDGDSTHKGWCHSCHKPFPLKESHRLVSLGGPLGISADEQNQVRPDQVAQGGSVWQDTSGQPLTQGQIYSLHSPRFPVPDEVQVVSIKPHELGLKLVGQTDFGQIEQQKDPNVPTFRLKPEDITTQQYTFAPSQQNSSDQGASEPPLGGTPGLPTIPDQGMTTDQQDNTYPNPGTAAMSSVHTAQCKVCHHNECDGHCSSCIDCMDADSGHIAAALTEDMCHKCGNTWIEHTAATETRTMHECARCLTVWETEKDDYAREAQVDLSWINDSGPGGTDWFSEYDSIRQGASMEQGLKSRSLSDAAAKDFRNQEIRQRLDANAQERTAGRRFSPGEQRALINEHGHARNADMLDLTGTHYETRYDPTGKANGENVPESHLFMGL